MVKISRVDALPISLPVAPFSDKYGKYDRMNYVVVKIHLSDGIIGLGEASPIDPSFYGETQQSIVTAIKHWIEPIIIGRDPHDNERLESEIDRRLAGNFSAKAAIDIALYDALGKSMQVPLHALLGGRFREKAAVGLELGIVKPEEMEAAVDRLMQLNPAVIKLHVGTTPDQDIAEIKALHHVVGSRAIIRADSNGAYTTEEAIRVLRKVQECELEYFEQPVSRSNLRGLVEVRRRVQTPIAVDESVWTPHDAMDICREEAADVINIKLTRVGGLNRAKKIADIANYSFVKAHVGCEIEFGIAMAAKVHMAVSLENATCASAGEFTEAILLQDNIVKEPYLIKNGYVHPNDKTGLGIDLDDEKMKTYEIMS